MAAKTKSFLVAVVALAVPLVLGTGSTWAKVVYLSDGAVQQADGTWDLPTQGTCSVGTTGYAPVPATRPECIGLRFPAYTSQAACEAVGTSPNNLAWTTSVCNDPAHDGDQAGCEAIPGRMYVNGKCAVSMKDISRNIGSCVTLGGTWVTSGTCTGRWNPPTDTGLSISNGPGDQCLRCHNERTQYNGTDIRWVGEPYMKMGHMNMARKVTVGMPWAGPSGTAYPSDDSGNVFDWITGRITLSGVPRDLAWIYGDWLSPLPRAIAKLPASTSQVCSDPRYTAATCVANGGTLLFNAGASYSCGRCHTTGWTSDATIASGTGPGGKEPERSFPGITWDRNSDANANLVNLSGNVSGDGNKYSSWDQFGIKCSRCHISVVDDTTNGGIPPFTAPIGMGRHHADNTGVGTDGGYCSDSRYIREAACESAGGTWFSDCGTDPVSEVCTNAATTSAACVSPNTWIPVAGWCSGNPSYGTDETACTDNGFAWVTGYCTVPAKTDPDLNLATRCSGGTGTNALSWRRNGSIQSCLVAGATWNGGFPACDPASICSTPGVYADKAACNAAGGTWTSLASLYTCISAGGEFTGTRTRRGQIVTSLCMECHRQETGGLPYDSTNPATALKVGPAHGTVAFVSHPQGNQFLNSVHGRFTGTFAQIPTATLGSGYDSEFQELGEAANTGNGCTGCHNPHKSTVEIANPGGAFREECAECHSNPAEAATVPQVDLAMILHAGGPGTPLEHMATEPSKPCFTCHMHEGIHLWRINTSPLYSTFPAGALTATVNANTSPDGSYTNAVWIDLDHACGQCHGGGTAQVSTTGSVAAGSKVLAVVSNTGFTAGSKVRISGAGALEEDGFTRGDFDTYVASVAGGTTVNLAGAVSGTVGGADVVQNATKNGASYKTKVELASKAAGIHSGIPSVPPLVMFSNTLDPMNPLTVNVDASASTCSGSSANCDAYSWSWGDGATGSGVTASHTYGSAGTRTITLSVEEWGSSGGTSSKSVTVYAPDYPPVASGTCNFNANTWTETVTDTSTDDNGVDQVTVNWGDGSVIGNDIAAPFGPFTHTYFNAGTYTVTHKAVDTIGQQNTRTCTASPAYFAISGTVTSSAGMPVGSAIVTVKKGTTVVKTVYTAANGTFSAGSLKPAAYTLTITKYGYTFASPAATMTVGPDSTGNVIQSAVPTKAGKKGGTRPPLIQTSGQ